LLGVALYLRESVLNMKLLNVGLSSLRGSTRLQQEVELRHAIEYDQFVMHYQPRVDISTGVTSSMESLRECAK
jgi:sensor c-di-GMP phosphodiesterase-like protein